MSEKNWDVVEVMLQSGSKLKVVVDTVIGAFAIHRRIWDGRPMPDGFTVCHKASGLSFWTVETEAEAIKVARWLDEQKIVPEGADEFHEWRVKLPGSEKTRLMDAMNNIGRRYFNGHHVPIRPFRAH